MDIQPGLQIEPFSCPPVTRGQLQAYAKASGDLNPIHLDDAVAKRVGLPGTIAHGMFIAGFVAERALRFVKSETLLEGFELVQFQTRFKAMTFLGDVLSISGTVKQVSSEELLLELQARNQRGEIATQGFARFKIRK